MKNTFQIRTEAAIKDASHYQWFEFTGKQATLTRKGKEYDINRGEKFGVRKSANGKQIRLVTERLGDTIVFTLDPTDAQYLAKYCKAQPQGTGDAKATGDAMAAELRKVLDKFKPSLDFGHVEYLHSLARLVDKFYEKRDPKAAQKAIAFAKAGPKSKPVKLGPNKYAIKIAKLVLGTSAVQNLYDAQDGLADEDLASMLLDDTADHINAACIISQYDESNKARLAIEKATRLDTASRDTFDDKVWDWIQQNGR